MAKEVAKAEVKTVAKEEVKAPVKEAAKETVKAPAKKTAGRKPAAKKAVKEETVKQITVQYQSNENNIATVEERVKAQFVSEGHRAGSIKKLCIYIKPEEYSAYYVINDKFSGRVDLF